MRATADAILAAVGHAFRATAVLSTAALTTAALTTAVLTTAALTTAALAPQLAAASTPRVPVLGLKGYDSPAGTGWGTYRPNEFFNGGDPSGHVVEITWKNWGHATATGRGRGFIFEPAGGYYPGSVAVDVRAFDLGHCSSRSPLAYQRLDVRYPTRPGGRLGKWTPWSASLCVTPFLPPVPTLPPAQTSAGPPCRNGQIAVTDAGGGAGLGHLDQVLLFTNRSQSTCFLYGYPGVAGLDGQGNQVVQAERTLNGYLGGLQPGATTLPTVSLSPGQTASAMVEGTDNPEGTATSCPYYPAFLVTPPGLTDSVQVMLPAGGDEPSGFPGCSRIQVHPLVPGRSGEG